MLRKIFLLVSLTSLGSWGGYAYAAACTAIASGYWNAQTTWGAAGTGCAGATGGIPGAADSVTIPGTSTTTVTVNVNSAAATLTFATGGSSGTVQINSGITLTVGGAVTINGPSGGTALNTLNVGTGTLNAGSVLLAGGGGLAGTLAVSTGTINVAGSITFTGSAPDAVFSSIGASTINIGGNLGSGGTLTTSGTGTINFNGAAAQTMGAYTTYNNVTISNTAGGVSPAGNLTIGGILDVNSGMFTVQTGPSRSQRPEH